MKRVLFLLLALLVANTTQALANQWVNGYYREDGTYVEGYWRSDPPSAPQSNNPVGTGVASFLNGFTAEKNRQERQDQEQQKEFERLKEEYLQHQQNLQDQNQVSTETDLIDKYGIEAFNIGDYKSALAWFTEGAKKHDSVSQDYIGYMYEYGFGVKQNFKTAFKYYLKSMALENSDAIYNVAHMYIDGKGVKKNLEYGQKLLHEAADKGHEQAQQELVPSFVKEDTATAPQIPKDGPFSLSDRLSNKALGLVRVPLKAIPTPTDNMKRAEKDALYLLEHGNDAKLPPQ